MLFYRKFCESFATNFYCFLPNQFLVFLFATRWPCRFVPLWMLIFFIDLFLCSALFVFWAIRHFFRFNLINLLVSSDMKKSISSTLLFGQDLSNAVLIMLAILLTVFRLFLLVWLRLLVLSFYIIRTHSNIVLIWFTKRILGTVFLCPYNVCPKWVSLTSSQIRQNA